MYPDVTAVKYLNDHRLELTFGDAVCGEVDFGPWILGKGGVFSQLEDVSYFAQVKVNPDLGTIVWPNDVDFDPEVLYCTVTGRSVPVPPPAWVGPAK
ncbi:MAG TPA: DUF2442 domain-containing protein [Tepidisphaeraceae bacterium]|jgi:hypothetical protein